MKNRKNTKLPKSFESLMKEQKPIEAYEYILFTTKNQNQISYYASLFGDTYLELLKALAQKKWDDAKEKLDQFEVEADDDDNLEMAYNFAKMVLAINTQDEITASSAASQIISYSYFDYEDLYDDLWDFFVVIREFTFSFLIDTEIKKNNNDKAIHLLEKLIEELKLAYQNEEHHDEEEMAEVLLPYNERLVLLKDANK